MFTELIKANTRGHFDHGWLDTHHTFSFADYYDVNRMGFGALRVINDDIVQPGEGFGTHPHSNMEIISIPLYGDLEHKDNMGNHGVIRSGEVQVMSAGTGITHSEFNAHSDLPLNFFQIWVYPNSTNVTPRYEQKRFDFEKRNELLQIVSPNKDGDALWIYQNAYFCIGIFDKNHEINYALNKSGNGIYLMSIEGNFELDTPDGKITLEKRDGIAIADANSITLHSTTNDARILIIEVPLRPLF
jgi:redox-sensitive bicupin YhaK (pirin superfamily)